MKTAIDTIREALEMYSDAEGCEIDDDGIETVEDGSMAHKMFLALTSLKSLEGQGWISVDERLPIKEKWVIVIADGAMNCAWYDEQRGWHNGFNERPRNIRIEDITHWQPLPSAPALTKSANP